MIGEPCLNLGYRLCNAHSIDHGFDGVIRFVLAFNWGKIFYLQPVHPSAPERLEISPLQQWVVYLAVYDVLLPVVPALVLVVGAAHARRFHGPAELGVKGHGL